MSSSSRNKRRKEKFKKIKHPSKKEEKNKWNNKSILLISTIVISFLFYVSITTFNSEITNLLNTGNIDDYRTTNATIYFFESKTMLQPTRFGNTDQIVGYFVRYKYKVNDRIYNHKESLSLNTKSDFLIYIANNINKNSFKVRYDITNPENAYLEQKTNYEQ